MKKNLLVLAASLVIASTAAFADSIDFNLAGAGGKWSWSGGANSQLTASFKEIDLDIIGNSQSYELNGSEILTFTTGGAVSGNGSSANPFTWGSGGTLTVTGCGIVLEGTLSGPCTNKTLFAGTFTDETMATNASGVLSFKGDFVAGTFDPSVYVALGISPTTPLQVTGALDALIGGRASFERGGKGNSGSGDLILTTATPEPASFLFLGTGLLGLGGLVRRRLGLGKA